MNRLLRCIGALAPLGLVLAMTGCVQRAGPAATSLPDGSTYVAMGSSFAAGPGITDLAEAPPNRCQRSRDNYAQQLARKRGLTLVDVSCGGATTAHILGPWNELPAQIDAVTPQTRLVTVTIGGNDVGFIATLMSGSCQGDLSAASKVLAETCEAMRDYARRNARAISAAGTMSGEEAWAKVEQGLEEIASQVRRRAPQARLIFVDYIRILPPEGMCEVVPLSDKAAEGARAIALRLEALTASVAARAGAELLKASALSHGHDACAADPWGTGLIKPADAVRFAPYHPTLAAMTGIAAALDAQLAD